jgi:hypothetical protein
MSTENDVCPHCQVRVVPMTDGTCPSCRMQMFGPRAVTFADVSAIDRTTNPPAVKWAMTPTEVAVLCDTPRPIGLAILAWWNMIVGPLYVIYLLGYPMPHRGELAAIWLGSIMGALVYAVISFGLMGGRPWAWHLNRIVLILGLIFSAVDVAIGIGDKESQISPVVTIILGVWFVIFLLLIMYYDTNRVRAFCSVKLKGTKLKGTKA